MNAGAASVERELSHHVRGRSPIRCDVIVGRRVAAAGNSVKYYLPAFAPGERWVSGRVACMGLAPSCSLPLGAARNR